MEIRYETIDELSLSLNIVLKYHYLDPTMIYIIRGKNKFKFDFRKDDESLMKLDMNISNNKLSGSYYFKGNNNTYKFKVKEKTDSIYSFIKYFAEYYKLAGHEKLSLKSEPENARF